MNLKYGAEAFAMLGIAYGLIKWVGRNIRSQISDSGMEAAAVEALASSLPASAADSLAADSLVRQGLVSAEDLAGMTPRERGFLIANSAAKREASGHGRARSGTPSSSPVARPPSRARSTTPASPRLHLITPSRPPLGVAVHCPGCGLALDRDALQRRGETTCSRCKRQVSAHIQRGRRTVIIEETADEAEHRRGLDGGAHS